MFKPKNLHSRQKKNFCFEPRFTFLTKEAPSVSALFDKEKETLKAKESINTGHVAFSKNADSNIQALAQAAYKDSIETATKYETTIKKSLNEHLRDGKSIEALWKYLEEQNCTISEIKDGILKFFREEKGNYTQIAIHQFLDFSIPATTKEDKALDRSLVQAKNSVVEQNRQARILFYQKLKEELAGKLPSPPSSIL